MITFCVNHFNPMPILPRPFQFPLLRAAATRFFILAICLPFALTTHARRAPELKSVAMAQLQKTPSQQLMKLGQDCIDADTLHDEAIAALQIVVNRFYKNQTDTATRHAAAQAFHALSNIYITRRIDYRKAYKSIQAAYQIASEDNDHAILAGVLMNKAAIHNFSNLDEGNRRASTLRLLSQAVDEAAKGKANRVIESCALNIVVACLGNNATEKFKEYHPVVAQIKRLSRKQPALELQNAVKILNSGQDLFNGNYEAAEKSLLALLAHTNPKDKQGRASMSFELLLSYLYRQSGQYEKGISRLMKTVALAHNNGWSDYEYTLKGDLALMYEKKGDKDSMDRYYAEYLKQRAELEVENGFGTAQAMASAEEIERINSDLEKMSIKHYQMRKTLIIFGCACVLLVVVIGFVLTMHHNLKRNNRLLFSRMEEYMAREAQYQVLKKKWEQERNELLAKAGETGTLTATGTTQQAESENENQATGSEIDKELASAYTNILTFMEKSTGIYQSGFALNDLATALGMSARMVSKAINTCHGTNFSKLLSEYRIREVIRQMRDPANHRYTLEMLAERAGFQSRSSFSLLFKKTVGLSPSQYMRMINEGQPQRNL